MFRNAQEDARKAVRRFPADFEQACEEAKLKLDSASRHPRYTVRNFIVIEVDENRLQTKITPRDGELLEMPTDVKAIVQHLVMKEDKETLRQRVRRRAVSAELIYRLSSGSEGG